MAHEIEFNAATGKHSYFGVGEPAWHKLGTTVTEAQTAREAMKLAGQDWEVETVPLEGKTKDGVEILTDMRAQVRSDNHEVLGIVSDRYKTVQNWECYEFLDGIVQGGELLYHTAGALGKGERVWMLTKLPDSIKVAGKDEVEEYLLLSNAHDGRMALRVAFTPIRVVCANTLAWALEKAGTAGYTFRHAGNIERSMDEARKALGLAHKFFDKFGEAADILARFEPTPAQLQAYYAELYPDPEGKDSGRAQSLRSALLGLFDHGVGHDQPGIKGTLWAGYNSITEYVDHSAGNNPQTRLASSWFGDNQKIKGKAFGLALELATGKWTPDTSKTVAVGSVAATVAELADHQAATATTDDEEFDFTQN